MKRIFLIAILFSQALLLKSEKTPDRDSTQTWTFSGNNSLSFNQLHIGNWAEGGESSLSGTAYVSFTAQFQRDKFQAEHNLNLGFGLLRNREKKFRKTEDRIDLTSTFGYKAFRKWNYTTLINFKTQFTDGFRYPNDSTIISTFMGPAYLTLSLGMQYKPIKGLSIFLSPASGKFTLVLNQELADKGAFGVSPAVYTADSAHSLIEAGKNIKPELGFNVNAYLKREVATNVTLESRLVLYNNYLDEDPTNRWNIDVNWEALVNFSINKFLSSNLRLNLLYDHNVNVKEFRYVEGKKILVGEGPRTQFKESFGIGLNYKF